MSPSDRCGAFHLSISPAERLASLRTLRLAVRLHSGPRGEVVERLLLAAELCPDDSILAEALSQLGRLGALDASRVWEGYDALIKPETGARE